ncbi:hypothetical protein B9T11_07770 [Wohlfahrtiimonas chitiniclastica]|uniref:host specificity protein J n=1 Tax=Wohlfahrtiimonas chitiniclastica TaxID=400946 RepID=UPI000B97F876|nr:phage tail protein [Wohlfahrtiimonas chitiniclastica]OYQ79125.1 hypothetical protein B9T11_07770 [Wohlfahrtiimonas chitiniclastica]
MGGKSGGGSRSPRIDKNTLNSAQKLKIIDLISSGEISGFIHGNDYPLKSVYLNDTPVQNSDGSMNHAGVQFEFNKGTLEQDYLPSAASVDNSVSVGVEVEKKNPITRTITNQQITSVRVTVGVDSLMRSTREGDQLATSVDMSIQIVKNGQVHASQHMHLNEKGNQPFRVDYVFSDLPAAPFDIKCIRLTADSNDDMLRNKTYFFSYVESIDSKLRMPGSAVAMLQIDSQQFGSSNPTRNYGVKGCIVQVPSNYDPINRTYSGLWDRLFKPAYTNNPAWILYDILTNHECFGDKFKDYRIDIDRLYELSKYCDVLVDDGNGGKEPRFVCNMVLFGSDASTVLDNICSVFRGTYSNANNHFTVQFDQKSDPVAVYNNSSVENGEFNYSYVPSTELFNQVKVEYIDKHDGCRTKIDEVSDEANIAKYGLKSTSITAFGCTKRSYALRCAKWNLVTALTENETVTFIVGAAGIRHEQHDIIKIADNDYAGAQIGGRIESVNGNTITVDRELKNVKEFMINVEGAVKTFKVMKVIDAKTYQLDGAVNSVDYAQFVATLDNVEPRLFRCIHIEEDSDVNKYTITAIKHNPHKEAIVDKGAAYIEGKYSVLNALPQLSNGVVNTNGRALILRWDSLETTGSVNKYIVHIYKGVELIQRLETKETSIKLVGLPQGNYTARIRAINEMGQHSEELHISFSTTYEITGLRHIPIVFGLNLYWEVPSLLTTEAYTEIWWSQSEDRSKATLAAKMPYPQNTYTVSNLGIKDGRYFWFRLVDLDGNQGEFTRAFYAESSNDSTSIIEMIRGKVTLKELSDDVATHIIEDTLKEARQDMQTLIDQSTVIKAIQKKADQALAEAKLLEFSKATESQVVFAETAINRAIVEANQAEINTFKKTTTDQLSAQSRVIEGLKSEVNNSIKSSINEVKQTTSDNLQAQAQSLANLKSEVDQNIKASLDDLKKTTTTKLNAQAKSISTLKTEVNKNLNASINTVKQTIAGVDGKVKSQYTLTTTAMSGGKKVISGFTSLNDGKTSEFIIQANKFAIVNQKDGSTKMPFILWQNKLALDGDLIASGTIKGESLVAGAKLKAPVIEGGTLNINRKFIVSSNGDVTIRSDPAKNVGLRITSERILVYDNNGIERIRIGKL